MRKKDYIEQLMAVYKELELENKTLGPGIEIRLREPESDWSHLVNQATGRGMENMEIEDLVRMADFAKNILR